MSPKNLLLTLLTIASNFDFIEAFQSPSPISKLDLTSSHHADSSEKAAIIEEMGSALQRREFIKQSLVAVNSVLALSSLPSFADTIAETQKPSTTYVSPPNQKYSYKYTVTPPPSFTSSNKPLKTHLDEINFSDPDVRGYTLGITVDPVRIKSIREFGSPEEVAARVVTAEINRDGVFEVTLAKDPVEDPNGCYDIEYISSGKRGVKRFVTRIYIQDGFLYVLTAQSKNDEYNEDREKEVLASVKSFRPL